MYAKLSKYWSEYSPILAMAAVLDPRYKMQYVEFTYKKLYGRNFRDHSDRVWEKLHDIFSEYVTELPYRTSTASTSDSSKSVNKKKNDTMLSKSTREMLLDILSIPVSTVASKSTFSNGGRVLDQYRSSSAHKNVQAIICVKDWLFGISGD